LAADYHILADLGFQQLTSLFDLSHLRKLRLLFTANCATAALPGNIKLSFKKQKCFKTFYVYILANGLIMSISSKIRQNWA